VGRGTSSCSCRVTTVLRYEGELWLSGRLAIGERGRCAGGGARRDASAGMGGIGQPRLPE
jgi:hypothetical protein